MTWTLLAQAAPEDLHREAGLRGSELSTAVLGLSAVFALGFLVVLVVVLKGRKKRR